MILQRRYAPNYRQAEVAQIASWLEAGESGTVVGLAVEEILRYLQDQPLSDQGP